MANIIDYVRSASGPALQFRGMNTADALALALMAGIDWDMVGAQGRTLARAFAGLAGADSDMRLPALPATDASGAKPPADPFMELARTMAASERFGGIMLYDFVRENTAWPALQFGALTLWDGQEAYITFRGTDASLAGWFEDLQLAYAKSTPSQERARIYFERAAAKFKSGLYLGGHSKGGALALYAAANTVVMPPRLKRIFSFDGPGVARAAYESAGYAEAQRHLLTIVPPQSVVGMLLWRDGATEVVFSDAKGVRQHDPMSWLTDAKGLRCGAELSECSLRLRDVTRAFLMALPSGTIAQLADAMYALVLNTGASTIGELRLYFAEHPEALACAQKGGYGRILLTLLYILAAAGSGDSLKPDADGLGAPQAISGMAATSADRES